MNEEGYRIVRSELHRLVREQEAALATDYLPETGTLLEIGAGAGIQAVYFKQRGYQVQAIDVVDSPHIVNAIFPVQIYDGRTIPFADESFDIVFSSHVLEHVPWCDGLLTEMQRVLKSDGVMVHIVPNACWRFWTSITHYLHALQVLLQIVIIRIQPRQAPAAEVQPAKGSSRRLWSVLLPSRHGVKGNWCSEVYFFSGLYWKKVYANVGLHIVSTVESNLFYTGYGIPGPRTSLATRQRLARWLGSSSTIYVLNKSMNLTGLYSHSRTTTSKD